MAGDQLSVSDKFKMDGKDYPDGMGGTAAWKSGDANTWEMVSKANGKVVGTETFKLSANGKTLTDSVKQIKADGGALQSTSVYERVSGDSSLAGKWKTRKVSGAAGTIEFIPSGTDGLIFKNAEMGLSCNAKLDGKDYPCSGPMLPPGFTIAMTTAGRSLNLTVKKDGKAYFKATQTVAADGKTMTETGFPAGTDETFKLVYDRL